MPVLTDQSKTLTFVFTDIESSTNLWDAYPSQMRSALARHQELIASAVAAYDGTLVKSRGEGDSTFSVYPRGVDALDAVAQMQQSLFAEPWPKETPIRVRAGIHTGTAFATTDDAQDREDFNSTTVNRCARIRALAHGGQVLVSEAAYLIARDDALGYEFEDLGMHSLKGLTRPERIYQVILPPLFGQFPPLASDCASLLPTPVTSFLGRKQALQDVSEMLLSSRIVTITGMGGSGKTRLAIELARLNQGRYPDGVGFAPLASARNENVADALLANFHINPFGARMAQQALISYFGRRAYLLVLDGCEHVRTGCTEMARALIAECANLSILATSQTRLNVYGEVERRLGALDDSAGKPSFHEARDLASVQLFVERARAVDSRFALTPDNCGDIVEICRRLDGNPLAIELAAALTPVLDIAHILRHLDDRFELFAQGVGDGQENHRTLRAMMDWSYGLLACEEQALLRRLSVFRGGCTLEACRDVCADPSAPAASLIGLLARLIQSNLLLRSDDGSSDRYLLHETARIYAGEALRSLGEADQCVERHRQYFRRLADRAAAPEDEDDKVDWLDVLDREHDNLVAAIEGAIGSAPGDSEAILGLPNALAEYWATRGRTTEGRWLYDRAFAALGDEAKQTLPYARALTSAGALAWQQGALSVAETLLRQSLRLREKLTDERGVADSLNNLGNLAWERLNLDEAHDLFAQSLQKQEALNDEPGQAAVLGNLALLWVDRGQLSEAGALFEKSLALDRKRNDPRGIATSLDGLGELALAQADNKKAYHNRREALRMRRAIKDRAGIAESVEGLALVAGVAGADREAAILLGAAERRRAELETPLPQRLRARHEQAVEAARGALSADGYDELWRQGYEMNAEAAIDLALGNLGEAAAQDTPGPMEAKNTQDG